MLILIPDVDAEFGRWNRKLTLTRMLKLILRVETDSDAETDSEVRLIRT